MAVPRLIRACIAAGILTALPVMVLGSEATPPPPTLRAQVMKLLEDIEQTRMLLGVTMWDVHDLRNFQLYGDTALPAEMRAKQPGPSFEDLDRTNLQLYERLKPIDYAGS
ncbi:MAG TPA: hypothetical protein VMW48_14240, partial [Vicinamibacterales bacterium]|nr:hypothetical protein [Vicinamibacterales bacterium]